MYSKEIDELRLRMQEAPDATFNETISKGALKMNDEQIATVSFVFWLVYMAETCLDESGKYAWEIATKGADAATIEQVCAMLMEKIGGDTFDVRNPSYFSQKIRIHQAIFGITYQTKLFWKLNTIRNDLSHNRISSLKYNNEPLSMRAVREKALLDTLHAMVDPDYSQADFFIKMDDGGKSDFLKSIQDIDKMTREEMGVQGTDSPDS